MPKLNDGMRDTKKNEQSALTEWDFDIPKDNRFHDPFGYQEQKAVLKPDDGMRDCAEKFAPNYGFIKGELGQMTTREQLVNALADFGRMCAEESVSIRATYKRGKMSPEFWVELAERLRTRMEQNGKG